MQKYIVKVLPGYKDNLNQYGNIIYEFKSVDNLIGIESELSLEDIQNIPYVIEAKISNIGKFE